MKTQAQRTRPAHRSRDGRPRGDASCGWRAAEKRRERSTAGPTLSSVSVYAGRTCLGFVVWRGKSGFEAVDADERTLGMFPDSKSAATAVFMQGGGDDVA
jgi:hypothetical protein